MLVACAESVLEKKLVITGPSDAHFAAQVCSYFAKH